MLHDNEGYWGKVIAMMIMASGTGAWTTGVASVI